MVYDTLELLNVIHMKEGACTSILYVDQVAGFFCQNQNMQSLKFFDAEFMNNKLSLVSDYIIYIIIGVSASFVIIVIITLILNKHKKSSKKKGALEDLVNHSKYLNEKSYYLHSSSLTNKESVMSDRTHVENNNNKGYLGDSMIKDPRDTMCTRTKKSTFNTKLYHSSVALPDDKTYTNEDLCDNTVQSIKITRK